MSSNMQINLLPPMDEDDENAEQENSMYFTNEEKLIGNSLKVNFFAQIIVISVFIFAASLADWTHIRIEQPKDASYEELVYHITLVTMKIGTSFDDFVISGDKFEWLQ